MQQEIVVRFGSPELDLLTAHVKALEEIAAESRVHAGVCEEIIETLRGISILLEHFLASNTDGERADEANAPKGGGSSHERA